MNYVLEKRILNHVIFSRKNTNIDVSVFMFDLRMISMSSNVNMIDTEKYQPAQQNMKLVTGSLRSLATKLHILARQADIFGINQFTSR
jgi:hypothetical protein